MRGRANPTPKSHIDFGVDSAKPTFDNFMGLGSYRKNILEKNGRTQTLRLGPYTVKLLNRGPKTMDVRGRVAPLVLQTLRYIGRNGVTREVTARLRSILSHRDQSELRANLRYAAAWMKPVIEEIVKGEVP